MIKSEIVTHEGNPGANWLDHCKSVVSPGKVTLLLVVAATVTGLFVAYTHNQTPSSAGTANTQATPKESQQTQLSPSNSLQVEPLDKTVTAPEQQSTPNLQSSSASSSTIPTPAAVGPAPTSSLQSQSTTKSSPVRSTVNTTLQSVNQTVQDTRTNVNNTLKALGL